MSMTTPEQLTEIWAEIDRLYRKAGRLIQDEQRRQEMDTTEPSIPPATTLVLTSGEQLPPGAVRVSLSQPSDTRLILHILTPRDKEMSHGPWGIFNITLENGVVRITRGSFSGAYRADEHALEFDSEGRTVIHDDA